MKSKVEAPRIRWLVEPTFDEDGVQRSAGIDEFGREHGDPVPMFVEGAKLPADALHVALRQLVYDEKFARDVQDEGFETFEDSEDFEVEDDYFPVDPKTPWEEVFDPPPSGGGESAPLASGAPNGKGGPEEPPTRPSSPAVGAEAEAEKVSVDSSLPVVPEKKVEMPTQSIGKVVEPSSRQVRKRLG